MTHIFISSARTSSLNSRPRTSPPGCLISISNFTYPKTEPTNSLLKLALPVVFLIWLMATILSLLRPRPYCHLRHSPSSHIPCPFYQQILLNPHSKYIQNLIISHHLYCLHPRPLSSATIISLSRIMVLASWLDYLLLHIPQSIHQTNQSSQIRSQILPFCFSKPISPRGKAMLSGQVTTSTSSGFLSAI